MAGLQEKQRYLSEQILDRNYDAQEFMDYCESTIGNADLQSWTYPQLTKIVKGFLDKKRDQSRNKQSEGEGSSFMNYQGGRNYNEEIDIDNIDINRQNTPLNRVEQQKPSVFTKVVNSVDQMFKNPFGAKSNEQKGQDNWASDMWNTISSPVVSLSFNNYNYGVQNQQTQKVQNDDFDIFGDFSAPTNANDAKTSQAKNTPKPIAKPPIDSKPIVSKITAPFKTVVPAVKQAIKSTIKPIQNFSIFDLVLDNPKTVEKTQEVKPIPTMSQLAASMTQSLYTNPVSKQPETTVDPGSVRLKAKLDGPRVVKQDFFDNISCIKAKVRNILADPTLTIEITGHQIAARSYMLPSYVLYTVVTKPLNIQVKRKYTYFQKLRQILSKFYPGVRLPYLDKSAWISQTSPQLIKNQKLTLQKFLNDILMSKQLRNCRIVEEFLTLKDKDGLRNKIAQYEKIDDFKSLEEMCLLRGSVDVAYTDQHRIYFEELAPLIQNVNSGVEKYKSLMEKLSTHYAALIKTYTEIEETFSTIQTNFKHFNSHVNFCEFYDMEASVKGIIDYYKQLNSNTRLEAKILEKQLKPFWNYQSNNINTIQELLDIRTKMTDTYNKSYSDHVNRNQPYLNNRKLDQSKYGIAEISKHPAVLKYQMGFFNQASAEQTMRMFSDLSIKMNHAIIWMTANRQEERIKELQQFYKAQKKIATSGL